MDYEALEKAITPKTKAVIPIDYYIHVIMQEKIKLYLEYVKNASFWYDIKLIFKTFEVISPVYTRLMFLDLLHTQILEYPNVIK